jgi:hypothetical protein
MIPMTPKFCALFFRQAMSPIYAFHYLNFKLAGNISIFVSKKSYFFRVFNTQQIFPLGIKPVIIALNDVISIKVFLVTLGTFAKLKLYFNFIANCGESWHIREVVIPSKVIVCKNLDKFNFTNTVGQN